MKTNKTNKLILRMLAAMLFLTASPSVFGQDLTQGSYSEVICDTSIIRQVNLNTALMYNRLNKSAFSLITTGVNLVRTWYIEPIYVNDFEIIDGIVYFCGYIQDGGVRKAAFGNFLLSTFGTDSLLWYSTLDTCTEFTKLDYFYIDEGMMSGNWEKHVVMVGTTGKLSNVLADWVAATTFPSGLIPPYGYTICDVYFSNNDYENFDDVAVTDNYVVFSSRRKVEGITHIDFWEFDRPTTIGYPIFVSNLNHLIVGSPSAETSVFLEHTGADNYAAVYKTFGYPWISLLQLNAPYTLVNNVLIFDNEPQTTIPMDIKYNISTKVYGILARNSEYRNAPDYNFIPMQIYHLTYDDINNPLFYTANGTRYPDYFVWSIDYLNHPYNFIASGSLGALPYYFKYRYNQWNCPDHFRYQYDMGHPDRSVLKDQPKEYLRYVPEVLKHYAITKKLDFPVTCDGGNSK